MSKFGEVKQSEHLFESVSPEIFLQAKGELESTDKGLIVATTSTGGIEPGRIYVKDNETWRPIEISKIGATTAPVFQSKRITEQAIFLRWRSGKNDDGIWSYDVIVRKLDSEPNGPEDGEIVGYSSIADQYAHPVDSSGNISVPDYRIQTELNRGFVVPLVDASKKYIYKIFSISTSGDASASDPINGYWTYPEIKETVVSNIHRLCFKLGDILTLPRNTLAPSGSVLHAQIVSFDYRYTTDNPSNKNMVLMMCGAIIDAVFDDGIYPEGHTKTNVYVDSSIHHKASDVVASFKEDLDGLINETPVDVMIRISDKDSKDCTAVVEAKMWLPSFMEIYGRYPIGVENKAYAAEPSDDIVKAMWKLINPASSTYIPNIEGHQFDLFKQLTGDELYKARERYALNNKTCQWYLRTMSLFSETGVTPAVFYVPHTTRSDTKIDVAIPVDTSQVQSETTSDTDNPVTQPIFCFRIDNTVNEKPEDTSQTES